MTDKKSHQGMNRRKVLESIGAGGAMLSVGTYFTSAVSATSNNSVTRVTGRDLKRLVRSKLDSNDVKNVLSSATKEVTDIRSAEEIKRADDPDIAQDETVVAAARKEHRGGGTSIYIGIVLGQDQVIRYVEQDWEYLESHQNDRRMNPKSGGKSALQVKSEARLYAVHGSEIEDTTLSLQAKSVNGSKPKKPADFTTTSTSCSGCNGRGPGATGYRLVEEDECTSWDLFCIATTCGLCGAACYNGCLPCCLACGVLCPGVLAGCCTNWETTEECHACGGTL